MAGSDTVDGKSGKYDEWVLSTFGVDPRKAVTAPGQAAPAVSGAAAPGGAAPGGAATGTIATLAGKLVYLMSAESKIKPILTIIADDYEKSDGMNSDLTSKVDTLEMWESRYDNYDENDVVNEVGQLTDRTSHEAAGSARGAEIVNEGFMMFVRKLQRDLPKVKAQIEFAENDIKIRDIGDQIQHLKDIKEGIMKVLDIVTDIVKIAEDVKDPGAWIDLGKDLVKDTLDIAFDQKIKPLEEQAAKLTDDNLTKRLALAKQTFADATGDIVDWEKFLAKAGHDLSVKTDERDDAYDSETNKKKQGVVRLNDLKSAAELAKTVYDLAREAAGTAHSVHSLAMQLQAGDTHAWISDPATTNKTISTMIAATKEYYTFADPKVNWSKGLEKRFKSFYAAAGNAMADKRVTS